MSPNSCKTAQRWKISGGGRGELGRRRWLPCGELGADGWLAAAVVAVRQGRVLAHIRPGARCAATRRTMACTCWRAAGLDRMSTILFMPTPLALRICRISINGPAWPLRSYVLLSSAIVNGAGTRPLTRALRSHRSGIFPAWSVDQHHQLARGEVAHPSHAGDHPVLGVERHNARTLDVQPQLHHRLLVDACSGLTDPGDLRHANTPSLRGPPFWPPTWRRSWSVRRR